MKNNSEKNNYERKKKLLRDEAKLSHVSQKFKVLSFIQSKLIFDLQTVESLPILLYKYE